MGQIVIVGLNNFNFQLGNTRSINNNHNINIGLPKLNVFNYILFIVVNKVKLTLSIFSEFKYAQVIKIY